MPLTLGCATPIAHEVYNPKPVATERVRASIREVHRGQLGGVVTIDVTNLSNDVLQEAMGRRVKIMTEKGTLKSLGANEFQQRIDESGPICVGFASWDRHRPPVLLDPLGVRVNINKGEDGLLHVAFEDAGKETCLWLDLTEALYWRTLDGRLEASDQPIVITVDLPTAPTSAFPTRDSWRNIHFGAAITSDMFP